jgi:hypothetical protein
MAKWMAIVAATAFLATAGCANSGGVTTGQGTPTPGASPTPTPASGDTYAITASPPTQVCNVITTESFGATSVKIDLTGGNFTPDWGFGSQVTVLDPPHGTLTGNNFAATWTWCGLDSTGSITTRHVWNWSGTFAAGDATFTSTLSEKLTNANGDQRSNCANVTANMGDCTTPGLAFAVSGTHT